MVVTRADELVTQACMFVGRVDELVTQACMFVGRVDEFVISVAESVGQVACLSDRRMGSTTRGLSPLSHRASRYVEPPRQQ